MHTTTLHTQLGPAAAADIKAEKPKSVAVVIPAGAGTNRV